MGRQETLPAITGAAWSSAERAYGWYSLFQRNRRGHIYFHHHPRPGELADCEKGVCRHRSCSEGVLTTLAKIGLIPHVGQVTDHLHNVAQRGPVLVESTLNFVKSIFALCSEITLVQDVTALSVFVFRPDAREKDHFPRTCDGHSFREPSFGPIAIVVVFLFERLSCRYG